MTPAPKPSKKKSSITSNTGESKAVAKVPRQYTAPTTGRVGRCLTELSAMGTVSKTDIELACARHNIKTVRFMMGHCRKLNLIQSSVAPV